MKTKLQSVLLVVSCGITLVTLCPALAKDQDPGYVLEHENEIGRSEPGTHNGGGTTIGFNFFAGEKAFPIVYRKRVLRPGSAIGYHLQMEYEIYHVLSGKGVMEMNGKNFPVGEGDAILTRPGNSHGLKQTGPDDLVIMIVYEKK